MPIKLPSRYEDLDVAFRGRLKVDPLLLEEVNKAYLSMKISGGIRFLPIYGRSGSGKTSSARELGTHFPQSKVVLLPRAEIESLPALESFLSKELRRTPSGHLLIALIDQYEEAAAQRKAVPTSFVEGVSLLDRGEYRNKKILFIWLTTKRDFQTELVNATSRNSRILVSRDFEILGPPSTEWPAIIQETFRFHNQERDLSDFEIIEEDLSAISDDCETIGSAIEETGRKLSKYSRGLQNLSSYKVIMLWPVTDGLRITRISQFTDARQGYKLDWNSWYRQLNSDDQRQLPLREFNRARLYFDVRLVPIAAADLHPLCRDLDNDNAKLHSSYLERFSKTHFFSIVKGTWSPEVYTPLRERESKRADEAREWYESVTGKPTALGKRIAKCFKELGVEANHEETIKSSHGSVRADVLVDRQSSSEHVIVELKAFSAENTMPSTICSAVQTTLRRHAQFAGFLQRT